MLLELCHQSSHRTTHASIPALRDVGLFSQRQWWWGRSQVLRWMSLLFVLDTRHYLPLLQFRPLRPRHRIAVVRLDGQVCVPGVSFESWNYLRLTLSNGDTLLSHVLEQGHLPQCHGGVRLKQREEYPQGKVRHIHPQRSQQGMMCDCHAHHDWNEG